MIKKLVLDLSPEDHAEIKVLASSEGETIRKWVLRAIAQRIRNDYEKKDKKVGYRPQSGGESAYKVTRFDE